MKDAARRARLEATVYGGRGLGGLALSKVLNLVLLRVVGQPVQEPPRARPGPGEVAQHVTSLCSIDA